MVHCFILTVSLIFLSFELIPLIDILFADILFAVIFSSIVMFFEQK